MKSDVDASVATELEKLESDRIIGESVVRTSRDRYASELGNAAEIERMRRAASVQPKTYRIPRRARRDRGSVPFIEKIKRLFGLAE